MHACSSLRGVGRAVASLERAACRAGLLALALGAMGCIGGQVSGPDFQPPPPLVADAVFVVTSDFGTGSYAVFPIDAPDDVRSNLGRIHSDAVALAHDGLVYVVNRLGGDSIQALDPQDGFRTLWECSVGNGTNPHDLVFAAPDKAYVTLYESRELLIVDPSVGASCEGFVRGSIDLAAFADDDGVPEADIAGLVGDRLFVALQRLDRNFFLQPTDFSSVAVIDVASDAVVDVDPTTSEPDAIRLTRTNPFAGNQGLIIDADGFLLLGEVGSFGTIGDGGIERVDPRTLSTAGFLITEEELGGNLTDFVLADGDTGYAIISDLDFNNALVRFDLDERRVTATLATAKDYLVDIAYEPTRGEIYLTDRTLQRPGIRIFRASDGMELTSAPIDTGLPPFDVVFLAGAGSTQGGDP